ncbi:hypothetical protein [Marisediminicola antarctica]|uniref:Phytanoyl-CoA dioxygenase n=1 Tax=Marisediminicola antarctica TaxID=674079 RepID=A0A7L5AKZ1_9MICO|nr:hypothetical protein [Marisediminicola antarctica]QHO68979.1 hypothetical protein BHD05_04310 [Marisediminicola antarctica]
MSYIKSALLDEKGYVILDRYDQAADPQEWNDLEYVDWKSSGVTQFAPLASAFGEIEANGFWNHTPPRTDKDGVWVDSQVAKAPHLAARAKEPGANVGRCRVIELQPNNYANTLYNLHQDDNNRLNPDGSGWIVRGFFNLTDDPESFMTLREDRWDPTTEIRIPLPAGAQIIVDTQRFWHAVWHKGPQARYCLITSWESGPALDAYIAKHHGHNNHVNPPLDQKIMDDAQAEVHRRYAERSAALAAQGRVGRDPADSEA